MLELQGLATNCERALLSTAKAGADPFVRAFAMILLGMKL